MAQLMVPRVKTLELITKFPKVEGVAKPLINVLVPNTVCLKITLLDVKESRTKEVAANDEVVDAPVTPDSAEKVMRSFRCKAYELFAGTVKP